MRAGKIWISEEILLQWLGCPRGVLLGATMLPDRRAVEVTLTDEKMPLVGEGEVLQVVPLGELT